jgi:hypothetical protein
MIQTFLKKNILQGLLLVGLLYLSGCASRYNTIQQKDPHEGDSYVYGDIGGPPKQAANKYEPDPKADARATAIREKMFGQGGQPE